MQYLKDVLAHIIGALIGIVCILSALLFPSNADAKNILLSVGASIVASAIVSFLVLFVIGNPFAEISASIKTSTQLFKNAIDDSFSVVRTAERVGLIAIFSSRSELATDQWIRRLRSAREEIFIIAYAMDFLSEHEDFVPLIKEKAALGCTIRFLLAKPSGVSLANRSIEEKGEGSIRSRVETTLIRLAPALREPKVELKLFDLPLYCSIFAFDSEMIVTTHLYGLRGAMAPASIIKDRQSGLGRKYRKHFYDIWDIADIYTP